MFKCWFILSFDPLRIFFTLLLCILQLNVSSQIYDDFSDTDLSTNPTWTGNLSNFEVNTYHQLHLKTIGVGTSYLSTALISSQGMEWRCWVHLSFAPSDNNNARIYLLADSLNPSTANKAFYLQLGEALSNDAVALIYKNGTITREICRGIPGSIANSFSIRIRVIRLSNGSWNISIDHSGTNLFSDEASGTENTPLYDGFFSLYCKYTSSNSTGFYFDDILIRPYQEDTSPPVLVQSFVTGSNQIRLNFNEPIEISSSLQSSNFSLPDGTHPNNVYADPTTGSTLYLDFNKDFPIDQSFGLTYEGIQDLNGNVLSKNQTSLIYHPPHSFDLLISEIMFDPSPPVGLPDCEYLELYNRSNYPININNWSLQTGKTTQLLPDSTIAAHAYVILSETKNSSFMNSYGKLILLKSLSLLNTGCLIVLKDKSQKVIHAVDYKPEWHDNASKISGGWSLEMIDPLNPCGESSNYRSSIDAKGGTPGSVNSVNASLPDTHLPQISSVFPPDSLHLHLTFSETVDSSQLSNPSLFSITPSTIQISSVIPEAPLYHSALLKLSDPLLKNIPYKLTINNTLTDCAGNPLKIPYSLQFGLPELLTYKCIVINEIMFDPGTGKEEFIEIYNRTSFYFDLHKLYLKVENNTSNTQKIPTSITLSGQLFPPGEYFVMTGNKTQLLKQFPLLNSNAVIEVDGFPALSNTGGVITLSDSTGKLIDKASFDPSMHFQMLRITTGVSLERIDPDGPSETKNNWQSAAETAGFSTPGKINSQHFTQNQIPQSFTLEPVQFTPDNDGVDDNLLIHYNPEKPGSLMSIIIYDIYGHLIRRLATNILLASTNTFVWNGLTDNHAKAPPGVYIVYSEIFNSSGEVKHFKKTTILATSLKR